MANDPGALLVDLVGTGRTVLHLGCGDASLARALVERGCLVSGLDAEAAPGAAQQLEELVVADLATSSPSSHFKASSFDVVVAGTSVLELADPSATLRDAATLLSDGGRLLVTARNAAHGTRRLTTLLGRPGEMAGDVLTLDDLCRHVEDAGLTVDELHSTVRDPLDGLTGTDAARVPSDVVEWVRYEPGALDDTYVAVARAADPAEDFPSRPPVTTALSADVVRVDDEHTAWVRRDREERHRMLTVRDHILGLEASLVSADARVNRARLRARAANHRARRIRAELDVLIDEIEQIARARTRRADLLQLAARLREGREDVTTPL